MFQLYLRDRDTRLMLVPETSLLEQCLAAGYAVARSCRNGNCGRCNSQLLEGRILLRDGKQLAAPATIALCLARPASDLQLAALPLEQRDRHWHCQIMGERTVRLPAGRQQPPRSGDTLAVFFDTHPLLNEVATVSGRDILLTSPLPPRLTATGQPPTIASLLLIDRHWQGDYALWQIGLEAPQCIWSGVNRDTALTAAALLKRGNRQLAIRAITERR